MLASNLNIANSSLDVHLDRLHTCSIVPQEPTVNPANAIDFLFNRPEHAGQFVEVVTGTDHPAESSYFRVEDFAMMVPDLVETYANKNIWMGALPRVRKQEWPRHGRSEDVEVLTVLYADLDGKDANPQDPNTGKEYFTGRPSGP